LENNGEIGSNRRQGDYHQQYSDDSDSGSRRRGMMDKKRGRSNKRSEPDNIKRKKAKRDDYSGPDLLPPPIRQQMTRIFEKCYQAVEESRAEDEQ
jgi:ATP-dependent helicase STH1/SNF2